MVKITIDIPHRIVQAMSERAHNMDLGIDMVYTAALAPIAVGGAESREYTADLHERIRQLVVEDGWCDADIAQAMRCPTRAVSDIRRSMGLPANRRKWKTR